MPDLPEASSATSADRCLVIAESTEAAYRYAASDARETDIVLASADGTFAGAEGAYARVVVAGFASTPEILGRLVDASFAYSDTVSVGASGQPVDGASDDWRTAFESFRVVEVAAGAFPAIDLAHEAGAETGEFLRGALSVLTHWEPRPDLRPAPTPVTSSSSKATKSEPAPASPVARVRRMLKKFVASHRRLVILAGVGALVVVAIAMGLVALINEYALGLLGVALLLLVGLSLLLQEVRGLRLQVAVARIDARTATLRDLAPPFKPATVAERMNNHATGLNSLQRSLAVVELASVDAAKTLERLEAALDADRGGRA